MNKDLIKLAILIPVGILSGTVMSLCDGLDPVYPYLLGVFQAVVSVLVIEKVDRWSVSK